MKCPVCGADNRDDVRFCRRCGNALATPAGGSGGSEPAMGVTCPACGTVAKVGTQFCPQCGQALPGGGAGVDSDRRAIPGSDAAGGAGASGAAGPQAARPAPPIAPAGGVEAGPPRPRSGDAGGTSSPPKPPAPRRFRAWPLWVGGAIAFVSIAVLLAVVLVRLLGDGSPLASSADPTATGPATVSVGTTPVAQATVQATATTAASAMAAPPSAGTPVTSTLHVELDAMPDSPRVGETFVLAALLVVPPEMQAQAQDYTLVMNGEPQLSFQTTPILTGLQAFGGIEGFPELMVFDAAEAGSTQLQVRVSVEGADGTVSEVLSPVLTVMVQE